MSSSKSRQQRGPLRGQSPVETISTKVEGRFGYWKHSSLQSVFEAEAAGAGGVYVWCVEISGRYRTYMVGEGACMGRRLMVHLTNCLSGCYAVYRAEKFVVGEKSSRIYGLREESCRQSGNYKYCDLTELMQRRQELRPEIDSMLEAFRIFLIPVDHQRVRQRLEAKLIRQLETVSWGNTRRGVVPRSDEESKLILIACEVDIEKLPSQLEI